MKKILLIILLSMISFPVLSMSTNSEQDQIIYLNRIKICEAVTLGNIDKLKTILDERLPIGDFSLGIFLQSSPNVAIAQMLINYGADVNGYFLGKAPLHYIDKMPIQVAELLLQAGANANATDEISGLTPLYIAVDQVNCDLQKVKLLLAHGADPSTAPRTGGAILAVAKRNNLEIAPLLNCQEKLLNFLKENNVKNVVEAIRNREIFGNFRGPR